ncbi:MAG: CYTH and CHAD domain-containing protein [Rhodocyclaceae bacterium]|nr:CYTH and CHAD domain-containing protein [Rhodocyclaceae bacterium]
MGQEIELKLALAPADLRALAQQAMVAELPRAGRAQLLVNTYYDTPDLLLRRHGIGLRTRKIGGAWLQTVKCARDSAGGLSSRPEWEQPYDAAAGFDFSRVDDETAARLLAAAKQALVPLFTTSFRREVRVYEPDAATRLLLMFDSGSMEAQGRKATISELELELERGPVAALFDLARRLATLAPMWPEDASKAQRGYALFAGSADGPVFAAPSTLDAAQGVPQAFRVLAHACLRQWQANAAGARREDDTEYLHQMRVGLRRLRSVLQLFAPALPEPFVQRWMPILRARGDATGAARDLDVLCERFLATLRRAQPGRTELEVLARHGEAERRALRARLRASLAEPALVLDVLNLAADLQALPDGKDSLPEFARARLTALYKRAKKRARSARAEDDESLHRLRVALKALRYGTEFLTSLLDGRRAARYAARVARAQDGLGKHNDLALLDARLGAWTALGGEVAVGAGFAAGWYASRGQGRAARQLKRARRLLARRPPWE